MAPWKVPGGTNYSAVDSPGGTTYSMTGSPKTGHRACGGEGEASFPDHME